MYVIFDKDAREYFCGMSADGRFAEFDGLKLARKYSTQTQAMETLSYRTRTGHFSGDLRVVKIK